ncbi:MAG: PorP/SprF family type IX secretion system membrane protein [Bacteroidota bacterium]
MIRFFTSTLLLCLVSSQLSAQDPSFSQFYANRVYLNPAFTGLEEGLTLSGISRLQWVTLDRGFYTHSLTAEIQEPFLNSGFGLTVVSSSEGLMNFNSTSAALSYAYIIPGDNHNVHFGLQARWMQRTVDWDRIIFSDELDPIFGPIFQTSATPVLERATFWDADFGMVWRFNGSTKRRGNTLWGKSRNHIGLAIHHLPSLLGDAGGDESLQNLNTYIPPRITFHAGSLLPLTFLTGVNNELVISPNLKFDIQGTNPFNFDQSLKVFTYGAYFLFKGFYFGAFYQNRLPVPEGPKHTNTFIFSAGAFIRTNARASDTSQKLFFGVSADLNTTGVGTEAGGTYEAFLRWHFSQVPAIFGKGDRSRARILDCNSFF